MIGALTRALDGLLGRGDAVLTVPALDGALRPNSALDAAGRLPLVGVDDLALCEGQLLASAGSRVLALDGARNWRERHACGHQIAALAALPGGGLAIALADGEIHIEGGPLAGRRLRAADGVQCITALAADATWLYVANGSSRQRRDAWQRDLMQGGASGSVWRIELASGNSRLMRDGLAWPAGLALGDDAGQSVLCTEAWRHRILRIDCSGRARPETLLADLPGYPGRLTAAGGEGWWLAVFAPRSQLVEFVLREPAYRRRMLAEVPQPFWIAPSLRSGRSFYEPLQGGAVKQLGRLKPWAPALSTGLCVRLDRACRPLTSLHSRADGQTHGVTALADDGTNVFAAAHGDGVVVALPSRVHS